MKTTILLHAHELREIIERLASEIITRHASCQDLTFLGIQRRGADLAARLVAALDMQLGYRLPFGTLDINLYRDDWTTSHARPVIGESCIPAALDRKAVILVDDVLFTGRTVRAALEAILDYGRPRKVELLVLVDRGHRELPIHADYVGKTVSTSRETQVNVLIHERDGQDAVILQHLD